MFTDGNPFQALSKDKLADYILHDINDGSMYHDAYLHYVQVPGTDILVPIIFYIDKLMSISKDVSAWNPSPLL